MTVYPDEKTLVVMCSHTVCGLIRKTVTLTPLRVTVYRAKLGKEKASRHRKLNLVKAIYARDGAICRYCQHPLMPFDEVQRSRQTGGWLPRWYPTLDHIVPRSAGGRLTLDNLVVACRSCNTCRGTQPADTFRPWKQQAG